MVEVDTNNYASKGVASAGLTTGIIGTALSGLLTLGSGGLGGLGGVGGVGVNRAGGVVADPESIPITRYEASKDARIAELETEVKLRDANTYTDQKALEVYQYIDGRLRGVEAQIASQAVVNAQITANIACMQNDIATLNGLTKTVIPIGNVCPQPMARYNSWTAPTDDSTSTT